MRHLTPILLNPKRAALWLSFAVGAVMLAACQLNPATNPPPTMTAPAPTETSIPPSATPVIPATVTLPPATATSTPEPTATATPAATATPDPNLGVGATIYEDKFDCARWCWFYEDDAVSFSLANNQLNAVMKRGDAGWRISSGPDFVTVGDQQLRVTARTNLCYERDEYGVFFRGVLDSNNNFSGYLFKLSCNGQVRVELLQESQSSVLVDWVSASAVVPGAPAENTLMVWAAKEQFHFYVNDKYVASLSDKTFAEGGFGLYLRDRTNGGASVSFAALTLKEVKRP
jgi:hypothetical protein